MASFSNDSTVQAVYRSFLSDSPAEGWDHNLSTIFLFIEPGDFSFLDQ
jgi:hypothetical protein